MERGHPIVGWPLFETVEKLLASIIISLLMDAFRGHVLSLLARFACGISGLMWLRRDAPSLFPQEHFFALRRLPLHLNFANSFVSGFENPIYIFFIYRRHS